MNRDRTMIRTWAALAGVALATACGGGDSPTPTAPPTAPDPPRATSVAVNPATAELDVGETVQLAAVVRDQNSNVMAGASVTWMSGAGTVATVNTTGLVTGIAEGTATITASAGSAQGTAQITVVTAPVVSVEVSPSAETIAVGATLQLTAEAFDANGQAVAGAEFSWESSDASVATVDATGLVTGIAEGTATITASAGDARGTATVTVVEEVVAPDDHGNSIATATPVAIGATVQGVLTEGDEDYFEIPVPTDGFRLGVFTEGNTDTYGTLFDQNGVSLSSDDDSGEALNFHIVQVLDAGTYYLNIVGLFGDTGDYSLVVEEVAPDDHGNVIATATPVAIGATVQGVLTEGDEDYFEIPVPTDGFRLTEGVFTEGNRSRPRTPTGGSSRSRSRRFHGRQHGTGSSTRTASVSAVTMTPAKPSTSTSSRFWMQAPTTSASPASSVTQGTTRWSWKRPRLVAASPRLIRLVPRPSGRKSKASRLTENRSLSLGGWGLVQEGADARSCVP